MISVQNLLRLLSGNKWLFFLVFCFISCGASRKASIVDNAQIVPSQADIKKENPSKTWQEEVKTVSDTVKPIVQPRVVPHSRSVKPDTIIWSDVTQDYPPIRSKEKIKPISFDKTLDLKPFYKIKMLLPFNSNSRKSPEESKYVHFYAGALLAIDELDDMGVKLHIDVIDIEEGAWKISDRLNIVLDDAPDVIIGPADKDNLQVIVDTCRTLAIPVVSPFYTSTKLTQENPYYIQIKPNLKDHFKKITEYCINNYKEGEVAIILRPNRISTSWMEYFQSSAREFLSIKGDFFKPYIVPSDSLGSGNVAYSRLYSDSKIKAVIIPNYSFGDEDFVYSSLRKLMAEKSRQISVIGMPLLYDSNKIDFDFYHVLNMKIVMSDFVSTNHRAMKDFRRRYLDTYGHIAPSDAVQGYDLMMYIGRNIWKYGKNFQYYLGRESEELLQSIFKVEKSYSDDSPLINDPNKFDYFENKHLDIIEFKGDNWFKTWR